MFSQNSNLGLSYIQKVQKNFCFSTKSFEFSSPIWRKLFWATKPTLYLGQNKQCQSLKSLIMYISDGLLLFDFRFHMNGGAFHFTEEMVRFVCAEIGTALEFLRSRSIVHRFCLLKFLLSSKLFSYHIISDTPLK